MPTRQVEQTIPAAPRLEISLAKIKKNSETLTKLYGQRGISIMAVSKSVLGEPAIVRAMLEGGIRTVADSRIESIQKMKKAGLSTQFVLLQTALSKAEQIIEYADISFNTEYDTVRQLSLFARKHAKVHRVVLMIEMGDLREGILPVDVAPLIKQILKLPNIQIVGLGCNWACFGGAKPDQSNMSKFSKIAEHIEGEFKLNLDLISGGNSANYNWFRSTQSVGKINNLRLGESILLGRETISNKVIPGLSSNGFRLFAEIIEAKEKTSIPIGSIGLNAFGQVPPIEDFGTYERVILGMGRQDFPLKSMKMNNCFDILGSTSDHTILKLKKKSGPLEVGAEIGFDLDYAGLLAAMTSPFVKKHFV